ncbi:hypothetical protein D9756_001388 [Leucocoprinus leucothites]|uniref:Uncharacterized protein n=1 Tax=Leucocoprinus leucothites TaxID=201217 RepID=A0A8H5G4U2_9AGAR|nr:hypothetical protein D9756_001388 [Leucoagaricus leucothites]
MLMGQKSARRRTLCPSIQSKLSNVPILPLPPRRYFHQQIHFIRIQCSSDRNSPPPVLPLPASPTQTKPSASTSNPQKRVYAHINVVRELQREIDDLSDEENGSEDTTSSIHSRGDGFHVSIGQSLTQQEKNNEEGGSEDSGGSGFTRLRTAYSRST